MSRHPDAMNRPAQAHAQRTHHAAPSSLPRHSAQRSLLRHALHASRLNLRMLLALISLPLLLLLTACDVESLTSTPTPGMGTATATGTSTSTSSTRPQATATTTNTDTGSDLPTDGLEQAVVERVVDGDTVIVWREGSNDTERLRYIGVDTPESVDPNRPVECYGPEATDVNVELVDGAVVWLERDISDTDQYGRLLRYVYVEHNGDLLFVNQELIRQGAATVVTFPPDTRYTAVLRAAQNEARAADRGLWGSCTP